MNDQAGILSTKSQHMFTARVFCNCSSQSPHLLVVIFAKAAHDAINLLRFPRQFERF